MESYSVSYGWLRNKGCSAESVQTEAKVLPDPTLMEPIIQWNCRCHNINFTVPAFLPIAGVSTILASLAFYIVVLISTHLQAVVVRISLDKTITLCSVYTPPNSSLSLAQLKNIADQCIIVINSVVWGSKTTNDK